MPRKIPQKPAQMPQEDLDELLKSLPSAGPSRSAPPSTQAEEAEVASPAEEDSSPAVNLGSLATEDLSQIPPGMFSDEPPPGFAPPTPPTVDMDHPYQPVSPAVPPAPTPDPRPDLRAAPGKVFPKSGYFAPGKDVAPTAAPSPYDPNAVNAARASLLEDAARARAAQSAASARPGPSVPTAAPRRPNSDFAVQRALEKHETASHALSSLPKEQQYRSRISVNTAYRYDGAVRSAPDFIDRNWISYDHGPALNIPNVGMLHVGEWLVIQDILDDDGTVALTEFKIYDDYTFHSMFMPLEASAQATHEAAA